jgi:hypothetical protein
MVNDHRSFAAKRGPAGEGRQEVRVLPMALTEPAVAEAWQLGSATLDNAPIGPKRMAFRFACKVCRKEFLSTRRVAVYCSRQCRYEGLAALRRAWCKRNHVLKKMSRGRIAELVRLFSELPIAEGMDSVPRLNHARRMMAYA